jgi:hypothetical protein
MAPRLSRAALADAARAIEEARKLGQAASLMFALIHVWWTYTHCGYYAEANAQADEVVALGVDKGALLYKSLGMLNKGCVLALTGKASKAK